MAPERRREVSALIDTLFAEAHRFDFFQAVRLLEHHERESHTRTATAPRRSIGHDSAPDREVVRIRAQQSLAFPATAIDRLVVSDAGTESAHQVEADESGTEPPEMFVNFMGMTGPSGVLPRHYTHTVLQEGRGGSRTLRDFLDLFNHRLISLFYRAWLKYRASALVESGRRHEDLEDVDLFTFSLSCLVGMGTDSQRQRLQVHDDVFLYYSGNFSSQVPKATCLQSMVCEFLQEEVRVREFQGRWLRLSQEDQTRMPVAGEIPSPAIQLGMGAVLGEKVWDLQSKFRVRVGPTDYRTFSRLMPSGDLLRPLCQFIRNYVGAEFDYDVQVVLHASEVPLCTLTDSSRLGWNTWVRSQDFERDVEDGVFSLPDI